VLETLDCVETPILPLLCIAYSTSNAHVRLAKNIGFPFAWAEFSELRSSPDGVPCPFQLKYALVIKLLSGLNLRSTDVYGKFLLF